MVAAAKVTRTSEPRGAGRDRATKCVESEETKRPLPCTWEGPIATGCAALLGMTSQHQEPATGNSAEGDGKEK